MKKEVRLAGVMGHPIHHSLSPEIFHFLSQRLKTPLVYRKMNVPPSRLSETTEVLRDLSLLMGWNVTIPHKETIVEYLNFLSPEARILNAVNVVQLVKGELHGFNTDIVGVLETLREHKIRVQGRSVLLWGAGGAALSVAYALGKKKAKKVWITNRSLSKAEKVAILFNAQFPQTEFEAIPLSSIRNFSEPVALYVNATPLGMVGYSEVLPLPLQISSNAFAFDLVYRPENTAFLQALSKHGLKTVGGLDMLIWQAIAAWEIWIQKVPHRNRLKADLKRHLKG